jgi:hypothetical protein
MEAKMQIVVTTSEKEARRSRLAQFSGRSRTLELAGSVVTGFVHSVVEIESSEPACWQVTVRPAMSGRTKETLSH